MLMLSYHRVERLYYRSFPYKLVIRSTWAMCGKVLSAEEFEAVKKHKNPPHGRAREIAWRNQDAVSKLFSLLSSYDKHELRTRIEGHRLSMFFKDRTFLDRALQLLPEDCFQDFYEPNDEKALECLLSNERIMIKKKLVHDCRYKIMLTNPRQGISAANKQAISSLLERSPEKFKHITPAFQRYLKDPDKRWFYQNYLYVENEQFLMMLRLVADPIIKEVIKMITEEELKQKEKTDV